MSDRGGLDPGVDLELGEDVGDVDAGGLGADEQRLGDLVVAAAGRDQGQHLGLAWGEAELDGRGGRVGLLVGPLGVLSQVEAGAAR